MTGCAVTTNVVAIVRATIIGVVAGFGVAGLADPVPWLTIFIKGEVLWFLLKYGKIKGTGNAPCFFSNELQISCFYTRMRIGANLWTMRVVTAPALNECVSAIDQVSTYTAHACCLAIFHSGNFYTWFPALLLVPR